MIYPTSRCHAHGDKFVGRESLALSVALTVGRLAKDGHPAFAPASVVTIDSARPDGMQPGWLPDRYFSVNSNVILFHEKIYFIRISLSRAE